MGRYAFFDTDLEYKFRFGVQSSSDIRSFGGRILYEKYEGCDHHHEWEKKDIEYIMDQIKGLLQWIGEEPVEFEKYAKNREGTNELKHDLYHLYEKDYNEELVARYILGCCIYHQLLYTDKLTVVYEGWN